MFVCIIAGILTGLYLEVVVPFLEPLKNVYVSLLQVCSLPIIICAITINIGKLTQKFFRPILKKWIFFTLIVMLLSCTIGISISCGMKTFLTPSDEAKVALSKESETNEEKRITDTFSEINVYGDNDISNESNFSFIEFLVNLVPQNIFNALSNNKTLQVFIFFIIFGFMLSFIEKKYSEPIINLFEGINNALYKFMNVILLFLPFAVFIMMASLFSNSGMLNILQSLMHLIIVTYIAMITLIILSFIVVFIYSKTLLKQHLHAIKRTFFVAIGTSSIQATVPVTIEDSIKEMNADKTSANVVMSIGTIFCPSGKILASAILAIYALIIYGKPINLRTLFIVAVSSILYSICISGASGVASATVLTIILQPLGIPNDVMSIILIFSVQFYQGISTFTSLYSNLAITFLSSPKKHLIKDNGDKVVAGSVS